jgi:hypothetical protein
MRRSGMNQVKVWEAKLDYLVVRQTDGKKSRECIPGVGSVGINLMWDDSD